MRQTTRIYTYTLYREPGHQVLLDHVSGRVCADWMQENENMMGFCCWKYLRGKLLTGQMERYRLKMHSVYQDEHERNVFHTRADADPACMPALCGYCSKWARSDGDRVNGLRMGVCEATGRKTERCHRCDAEKGAE